MRRLESLLHATSCAAVQRCDPRRRSLSFARAQNWSTSENLFGDVNSFGIQNRRALWQGDNFPVNVLSRSAWQSPVSVCTLSLLVSSDPWLWSSYSEKKPCLSPPPPSFVITKEQTHIKHTQGAKAVIAVSAVLLWVAGDDNISLRYICIFLIMSGWNVVSWEWENMFLHHNLLFYHLWAKAKYSRMDCM